MGKPTWAEPREITRLEDCYFYHTMDIPDHGTVHGEWDLRGREAAYLGNVGLFGKRVLEIGTASGHICFSMEKMGAEVVAYDLSDEQDWDIVPYHGYDYEQHMADRKALLRRLNNGFWLAHSAYKSTARVLYGTVYEIPDEIGDFDACTFGSVLLHLRDPFLALQRATAHVKETVIVSEVVPRFSGRMLSAVELLTGWRLMRFLPRARKSTPYETWWRLSPRVVSEFLQVLGFGQITVAFHWQTFQNKATRLFTVVGRRDKPGSF